MTRPCTFTSPAGRMIGAISVESLQGSFVFTDQGHNDVSGVGDLGLFTDHEISIHDVVIDHGITFNLKNERTAAAREIAQRDRFALFHGFQRTAGGDAADKRQLLYTTLDDLFFRGFRQLHNFDRAALVIAAADETLL